MTDQRINRIFLLSTVLFLFLTILAILMHPGIVPFWRWKLPVIFLSAAATAFLARRLSFLIKINLLFFGVFLAVGLYTLELFLPLPHGRGVDVAARKIRKTGRTVELFAGFPTHDLLAPLVPLAAISRTDTILCQESGDWQVYKTDEHGFNNPDGAHRPPVDIALIGDSFTQGYCVAQGADIASIVRKEFPLTINLGIGGAGPLLRLATLREYARPLRPKVVVWLETENTINRIAKEDRLSSYLDPQFTQSLRGRQEEIDQTLRQFSKLQEAIYYKSPLRQRLFLVTVRLYISRAFEQREVGQDPGSLYNDQYRGVLLTAQREVKSWGGIFLIGYISIYEDKVYTNKDYVKSVANELRVPFLDLEDAFSKPIDLNNIYPNGNRFLHYGEGGYRLVGEYLLSWLKENVPKLSSAHPNHL